ncbi:MAG: transglycosylase domain-containing protein, partial [Deltaproteobacteria bacterium]|nr:transglycosylase domain-containing protein [Deltaproteobacteria bacterium]
MTIGVFLAITRDLPQIRALETYRPSAVTRIYSSDNILLAELFAEKRDPVPIEDIPAFLKEALVATEDRKFYNHIGIDLKGIMRAIIKDIMAGAFVEGASTITQQLTKTLFLTSRKTLMRKIKEALLALQLERRYTKSEILELYLNQVYFGSGAYGVESAARIFFGKSVKELNLAESALIAGMPKAPSVYSPLINPELAIKRRNIVLKQMLQTGIINKKAYKNAIKEAMHPA